MEILKYTGNKTLLRFQDFISEAKKKENLNEDPAAKAKFEEEEAENNRKEVNRKLQEEKEKSKETGEELTKAG